MQQAGTTQTFKANARAALADAVLKVAIDRTTGTAETKRAAAVADFPEFDATRERSRRIKDHVIANLEHYLLAFERNAAAAGTKIHWASTPDEACEIVVRICRETGARVVTRSKSMLGEEIGLPHALSEAGMERVETDLAEHIIQLAGERPSHIIWPAMHRTREQIAVLFKARHRQPPKTDEPGAMVESARRELRDKFLSADVGIAGANFLVADTGAVCTVTNEGNAELTTSPPRVVHRHGRDREAGAVHRSRACTVARAGTLRDRRRADSGTRRSIAGRNGRATRTAPTKCTSCWSITAAPGC